MAKSFNISLKFDNEGKTIDKTNGLTIRELSDLLKDLDSILEPNESERISVTDISDNCYMPTITTNSQRLYNKTLDLHKKIYAFKPSDLSKKERKYANSLKAILNKGGKELEVLDTVGEMVALIKHQEIEKEIKSFFVIKNVTGIITEIGGPKLEGKTHIDVDGIPYLIYTNKEQDAELSKLYRKQRVSLKLKQKRSLESNKVIHASLLEFKKATSGKLLDNIEKLSNSDLSFLSGINTEEDVAEFLK